MPDPIACPTCGSLHVRIRHSRGNHVPRLYLLRCPCGTMWRQFGTITRSLTIEKP